MSTKNTIGYQPSGSRPNTRFASWLLLALAIFAGGMQMAKAQPSGYAWRLQSNSNFGTAYVLNNNTPATGYLQYTVQAATTATDYIVEWNSFADKWFNTSTPKDAEMTLAWGNSGSPNSVLSGGFTNTKYYTLNIQGLAYSNRQAVIMETDNAPLIAGAPSTPTVYVATSASISTTIPSTPSPQEKFFLRYTKDDYATSTVLAYTNTSGSQSVTIPAAFNTKGATVKYYVFTSTVDATTIDGSIGGNQYKYDLITLSKSAGSQYTTSAWSSIADGNWGAATTWNANQIPPTSLNMGDVTIAHTVTADQSANVAALSVNIGSVTKTLTISSPNTITTTAASTVSASNTISVSAGGTLAAGGGAFTNSGTITVLGNLQVNSGGFYAGTAPSYSGASSSLTYNTGGTYGISTNTKEWTQGGPTPTSGIPAIVNVGVNGGAANSGLNFTGSPAYGSGSFIVGKINVNNNGTLTIDNNSIAVGNNAMTVDVNNGGTLVLSSSLTTSGKFAAATLNVGQDGSGGTFTNNCVGTSTAGTNPHAIVNFNVKNTAIYNHNAVGSGTTGSGSDIPGSSTRSFATASQVNITKWALTSGSPTGLPSGVAWGKLSINLNHTLAGVWQQAGNLNSVGGDLTFTNTGGQAFSFTAAAGGNTSIGGTMTVNGPTVNITTGSNSATYTINALTVSSGTLNFTTSSGAPIINVTNALTVSGGTINMASSTGNPAITAGSVLVSSGSLNFNTANAASPTLTAGSFSQTGGVVDGVTGSATGSPVFNVTGSFNIGSALTSNTFRTSTTSSGQFTVGFTGTSAQTVTISGNSGNPWGLIGAANTSRLNMVINNANGINLTGSLACYGNGSNTASFTMTRGTITGGSVIYAAGSSGGTALVYNGTTAQTASAVEWPSSSGPTHLTINNAAGVTLPNNTFNRTLSTGITSGALTFTTGNLNLGGSTLTLGNSGTNTGTVVWSAGGLSNGTLTRWYSATLPTTAAATSRFPFAIGNVERTAYIYFSAASAGATAGTISVSYVNSAGTTAISPAYTDNTASLDTRTNSNWVLSSNTFAPGTANATLRIDAANIGSIGTLAKVRLSNGTSGAGVAGTNAGSVSAPQILRTFTGITGLANTWYYAGNAGTDLNPLNTVYNSIATGNWSSASTWDQNAVPGTSDVVNINTGHTVTVDGAQAAFNVNLLGTGIMNVATSNSLNVSGLTTSSASFAPLYVNSSAAINVTGGSITVSNTGAGAFSNQGATTIGASASGGSITVAGEYLSASGTNTTVTSGTFSVASIKIASTSTTALVVNGGTVNVNGAATTGVTYTGTGTIAVSSGILNIGTNSSGVVQGNNRTFALSTGTLNISGTGTVNLNGNMNMTGGTLTMSGGNLNLDANDGTGTASVAGGTILFNHTGGSFNVTGGTITIIDPPYSGSASALYYDRASGTNATWVGNTLVLGVGSTGATASATTSTAGFRLESQGSALGALTLGDVVVDGGNTNNRYVTMSGIAAGGLYIGGKLTVNANSLFKDVATNGTLNVAGDIVNNGTITILKALNLRATGSNGASVVNTAVQTISGSGVFESTLGGADGMVKALSINNSNTTGITLARNLGVTGTLTMTAGRVTIQPDANFTMGEAATLNGTPSATNVFVTNNANGTGGRFRKVFPTGNSSFTFPVGDAISGTFSAAPVALTFTANSDQRTIGVADTAVAHPNIGSPVDYLNRYWNFADDQAGTGNYAYSASYTFSTASPNDVSGTAGNIKLARYTGSTWNTIAGSTTSSPTISSGSLDQSTGPLGNFSWTGRLDPPVTFTWTGANDASWTDGGNWTNDGSLGAVAPTAYFHAVSIPNSGQTNWPSVPSGSFTVASVNLAAGATLAMASGANLNVLGAVTLSGTTSFDCGSTFTYGGTAGSQTVAAVNYGNLTLSGNSTKTMPSGTVGICGAYAVSGGAVTYTGSTVDYNGTGNQSVTAASYAGLSITGSSTRTVTLPSGTINIAGTFTPSATNVTYVNTGNTIVYNGAGAQTIAAFPSYNNLTLSGARGSATVTWANGGIIGVAGDYNDAMTSVNRITTGNTVEFKGSGAQAVTGVALAFNSVKVSNTGGVVTCNVATNLSTGMTIDAGANWSQTVGVINFLANSVSTFNGKFSNALNSVTQGSGSTITVGQTGTYESLAFNTAITIPVCTWDAPSAPTNGPGATMLFANVSNSGTPTNLGQSFYNFTWAGGGQTTGAPQFSGGLTTVRGTLKVTATGTGVLSLVTANGTAYAPTFGKIEVTGGTLNLIGSGTAGSNTAKITVTGDVALSGAGILEMNYNSAAGSCTVLIGGDLTMAGSSKIVKSQGATGTISFNKPIVNGIQTITIGGTATINNVIGWTVGTTSPAVSSSLVLGSNVNLGTGATSSFALVQNSTIDFGTRVLSGTSTFNLNSGSTLITANSAGLSGSVTVSGTKTFNIAGNYTFNATGAQTVSALMPATVNNLTITNNAGVSLSDLTTGTLTVNGALAFNAVSSLPSILTTTSGKTLIIGSAGSVSGASAANGWVAGNLQKTAANGNNDFEVGTTVYAPSRASMTGVSGTVTLTATVTNGSPAAGSEIDPTKKSDHYWNITKTGAGTFTSYDARFDFTNTTNGGTTTNYVVRKYEPSTWNATTSSVTGNTITATGLTSFSDFAIGESNAGPVANDNPVNVTVCSTPATGLTFSSTSTSTPTPTVKWQRDAGSGFVDVDGTIDGGVYSTFNTGTLNISSGVALNGYLYRAVYTNINGTGNSNTATLTVNPAATVSAGGNQTICAGSTFTLAGNIGGAATSATWSGGAGTFNPDANTLNAVYTPSAGEVVAGTVTLILTTDDPSGPCGAVNNNVIITINAQPAANAGSNAATCSGSSYTLSGATASNYSSVTWATAGDGAFDNVNALNPIYTPGSSDITNGSVVLTLTAAGNSPCGSTSPSNMTLTINATGSWTGLGGDNNWNTAANWCGGVPTSSSNVVIPAGVTINITSADAVANSVTISNTATLNIQNTFNLSISGGGSFTNNGTFSMTSTGKVNFQGNGTSNGTITYTGLEFNGTVTTNGNITVTGLLNITTGNKLVIGGSDLLTLNGTVTGDGTIQGSSTAAMVIGGTGALGTLNFESGSRELASLTVNRSSAGSATLGTDLLVGTLTLTNGVLNTGANTVSIGSAVARTNGWVNGNLLKTVANGATSFEVGSATVYAPATVTMTGVSGTVNLTGKATLGTPTAGSGIGASARSNHYWTITKTGAGTFTAYDAEFDFTNTTNGGTTANYVVMKFDGTWASTTSSVTGNTIKATGLTSFSDFEIGELFNGLKLKLNVLLQGALIGNGVGFESTMRDNLRNSPFTGLNYIPKSDPYVNNANYSSLFTKVGDGTNAIYQTVLDSATMFANNGTASAVDWVFIQLRSKTDSTVVLGTRSAIVLRNGTVLDIDGSNDIKFPSLTSNDYFVSVRHRNHLGAMTAIPVPAATFNSSTVVDFTTMTKSDLWHNPATPQYDSLETAVLSDGKRALWAGNSNVDGKVKYQGSSNDRTTIQSDVLAFGTNINFDNGYGYFKGDVNMDSKSKYQGSGNDRTLMQSIVLGYLLNTLNVNFDLFLQQLP